MKPRVTVVVPLYNKAPYLERALASITRQTFQDFEVIVVDDGSTDGGAAIVAAYPDPRFRLLRQPNAGPGAARNRGLSLAAGELVAFLDADDEWLPDYLQEAVERLSRTQETTCTCAYFEDPGDVSSESLWRLRGLRDGAFRVDASTAPEAFLHLVAFLSPCTTVARTSVVRRWGGFHDARICTYGEDAFLWVKVLLNETVGLDLTPRARIHREAAGLSKNLTGPRPLEPFLQNPEAIGGHCPPHLQALLASFYTVRAFKTACAWGYWGHWREARTLRRRFRAREDWRLPFFWSSLVCSTPIGAALGTMWRAVRQEPVLKTLASDK